jgi:hypothetical protein
MLKELGIRALALSRRYLDDHQGSKDLVRSLSFFEEEFVEGVHARGIIFVPQYWAEYVHDGRRRISLPRGRFLCFFPNKADDPRTTGGMRYPTRYSQVVARRLSSNEFDDFLRQNRERAEAGLGPIMVVTSTVRGVAKIPFFDMGLKPLKFFASEVGPGNLRVELARRG